MSFIVNRETVIVNFRAGSCLHEPVILHQLQYYY